MCLNSVRWIARAVIVAWAGWWTFFAAASSASAPGKWLDAVLVTLLAAVVFLGSALVAWRHEFAGGSLLVAEGLFFGSLYQVGFFHARSPGAMALVLLTLALPPLVCGLVFIALGWRPGTFAHR